MIGKTIKGRYVKGVLKYLLGPEKRAAENARIIAGTMASETVKQLAAEFEALARVKPDLKKFVYHQVLRPPAAEGLALTDEIWAQIAQMHAEAMGYADGQWLAIRHDDHIHIVANRVLIDGAVVSDSHDWARAERSVRAIEKRFGLTQVESSHLLEPAKAAEHERAPSQAEMALSAKGETSVRELIQEQLLAVIGPDQSLTEFVDRLYDRGVIVRPNVQSTGQIRGLSFVLKARPEFAFSGTSLGRRFTLGSLRKAGLSYDPQLDRDGVERCLQRCKATEDQQAAPREIREEPLRPLVDPKAAIEHLKALKGPVILAALDGTGEVKELGVVDSRTIGGWRRRLRRRCARGEEILVRPIEESGVLVIPRCGSPEMLKLQKVGIAPFLVVDSAWNRKDVWLRAVGGAADAQKLGVALQGIRLPTGSDNEPVWGNLAGYRPDPESTKDPAVARRFKNTIARVADTAVEVSLELLERLRRLAEILKGQMARAKEAGRSQQPRDEKGRSR